MGSLGLKAACLVIGGAVSLPTQRLALKCASTSVPALQDIGPGQGWVLGLIC